MKTFEDFIHASGDLSPNEVKATLDAWKHLYSKRIELIPLAYSKRYYSYWEETGNIPPELINGGWNYLTGDDLRFTLEKDLLNMNKCKWFLQELYLLDRVIALGLWDVYVTSHKNNNLELYCKLVELCK